MKPESKCVLMVEDKPADARLLIETLKEPGTGTHHLTVHRAQAMYCAKHERNQAYFYQEFRETP